MHTIYPVAFFLSRATLRCIFFLNFVIHDYVPPAIFFAVFACGDHCDADHEQCIPRHQLRCRNQTKEWIPAGNKSRRKETKNEDDANAVHRMKISVHTHVQKWGEKSNPKRKRKKGRKKEITSNKQLNKQTKAERQTMCGRAFRVQNRTAKRTHSTEIKQKLKKERQKETCWSLGFKLFIAL